MAARPKFVDTGDRPDDQDSHIRTQDSVSGFLDWASKIDGAPEDPDADDWQDWYNEWERRRNHGEQVGISRWSE